jgi:acetyl esterase/lipase
MSSVKKFEHVKITDPQIDEHSDVTYSQVIDNVNIRELKMSVLVPRTTQKKPAVLYFPGGGFTKADYHKFIQLRLALAKAGMVVASAEYRVIPDQFPSLVHDAKHALKYLYDNAELYGIDTSEIAVLGDSAGGYLSQFIGTTSGSQDMLPEDMLVDDTVVSAVVSLYGFSDLLRIGDGIDGAKDFHAGTTSPEALLVNGISFGTDLSASICDNPERAREASPISYVKEKLPPFLLMHGDHDVVVSQKQADYMSEALEEKGNEVVHAIVSGAGHGTAEWNQPDIIDYIVNWLIDKLNWQNKAQLQSKSEL